MHADRQGPGSTWGGCSAEALEGGIRTVWGHEQPGQVVVERGGVQGGGAGLLSSTTIHGEGLAATHLG